MSGLWTNVMVFNNPSAEMTTPIVVETTDNSVRPIRTLINKLMVRPTPLHNRLELL